MTQAIAKKPIEPQRDRALFIGDGTLQVPYSLAFSHQLSPLDIRVWMAIRACAENQSTANAKMLSEALNVHQKAVAESMMMLNTVGWIIMVYKEGVPGTPMLCAKRASIATILHHNPTFKKTLEHYVSQDLPRVSRWAKAVLLEMGE